MASADSISYGNFAAPPRVLTGRAVVQRKSRVDQALQLDVVLLQRIQFFTSVPGTSRTLTWTKHSQVLAEVRCGFTGSRNTLWSIGLNATVTTADGMPRPWCQVVDAVTTRCHFGGVRWWFLCPRCQRRSRIVYALPKSPAFSFACRECHRLTYESRQRHRNRLYEQVLRPLTQLQRLQQEIPRIRSRKAAVKWWAKATTAQRCIDAYDEVHLGALKAQLEKLQLAVGAQDR